MFENQVSVSLARFPPGGSLPFERGEMKQFPDPNVERGAFAFHREFQIFDSISSHGHG